MICSNDSNFSHMNKTQFKVYQTEEKSMARNVFTNTFTG